ncbi:MAG TPA: hypothetical protein VLD58_15070 [Gemmatimonadales bacterium]|nr:hypothetical protein [Gemmatimonadales bacterium]
MKASLRLALALGVAVAACGGGATAPSPTSFAGSWRATKVEYVSIANPATKIDVIAQGATLTVQLNAGGSYSSVMTIPGEPQENTTGTWSASSDIFTMHWLEGAIPNEMQFDYALGSSTLTLTGADTDFDFAGTGQSQAAKLNVTLVRQ